MRIIFLDIDGVLNRTGYHPGQSVGLRSWIEPELASRLSTVIDATSAAVVLSSDWRVGRELDALRGELAAAGWTMLDRKDGYSLEPAKKA